MSGIRLSDDWDEPGWVNVPRSITRDESLSFKALGLVTYLASHTAGFRLSREFIINSHRDGRDAVETGLRELRDSGYLTVEQARDEEGRMAEGSDYVLHRTVTRIFRNTDNPESGKSATKRTQVKENLVNEERDLVPDGTDEDRKEAEDGEQLALVQAALDDTPPKIRYNAGPIAYSDEFERAWASYGRKGAKRKAWAEWQRAIKRAPVETITAAIAPYLKARPDSTYRKDFERFLSGDLWESAECASAKPFTEETARAWLKEQWRAGNAKPVYTLVRWPYYPPDRRNWDISDAEWKQQAARQWITDNAEQLIKDLIGRPTA